MATREALLKVAAFVEKHDLVVISDELYDQLVYGVPHVCFPALPGIARAHHPFRRLLEEPRHDRLAHRFFGCAARYHALYAGASTNIPSCVRRPLRRSARWAALQNGAQSVREMRDEYNRRRRLIVDGLNNLGLPTFEPYGAFYAFPSIAATGMDDETFAQKLLAGRAGCRRTGVCLWRRR